MEYTGSLWPVRSDREGTIHLPKTGLTSSVAAGDDGDLQVGAEWPEPRFVDRGDGTVYDSLTGLMWTQNVNLTNGKVTWQEALDFVASLNASQYLGYHDWRLPNRKELGSLKWFLFRFAYEDPFTNVPSTKWGPSYWTSTTCAGNPTEAWTVWLLWCSAVTASDKNSLMYVLPVRSGELPPGVVTYSRVYTSTETLLTRQAILTDTAVTGALSGTLRLASFESVLVTTGLFTGKGFAKGQYQAMLDGISYSGNWQGALSLMPEEKKFYLNGSTSGGISAVVEGFLSESVPGSGVFDHYQATWKVGGLGETVASVTLEISGSLTLQGGAQYPAVSLEILQAGIDGVLYGHYAGPVSVVMTLLRVAGDESPYQGEGFSYMTYSAEPGAGESWSYAVASSPGKTALEGLMGSPLYGILHGMLDETRSPSTLSLSVERVDLGLPPAADLKVKVWGPGRVSPGQTVNYIIEYRNDGVKEADNATVMMKLPITVKYVSNTGKTWYSEESRQVVWHLAKAPPKYIEYLSTTVAVPWGLQQGTIIDHIVFIPIEMIEVYVDPAAGVNFEILEERYDYARIKGNIYNSLVSEPFDLEMSITRLLVK